MKVYVPVAGAFDYFMYLAHGNLGVLLFIIKIWICKQVNAFVGPLMGILKKMNYIEILHLPNNFAMMLVMLTMWILLRTDWVAEQFGG